jgi:very-short-patch-repair endonuclease
VGSSRIFNRTSLLKRRRELRASLTPAEARLWTVLKGGRLSGRKFRRQHSIGPYVVDFYCPGEQLIVELDGAAHDGDRAWRKDESRSRYLESLGLRVVRIANQDVRENLEGVLEYLQSHFLQQ